MFDTIIIGSGPAGITAAIYAKRANLSVLVIEKEYEGAGQIENTERVDNYPGLFGISGYELGEKFRNHAQEVAVDFLEDEVEKIYQNEDMSWTVELSSGEKKKAKTVIYCAGSKHKRLGITGEQELYGKGVSNCALCDGSFYQDKNVAVIGGGNSALEAAIYLSNIAQKVYLVHRREEFRGDKVLVSQIEKISNIELVLSVSPKEIMGEQKVKGLLLNDNTRLDVDGIFVEIGTIPNTEILKEYDILGKTGYIKAGEDGSTTLNGFFAAGDVREKKLRQVVTAVSDGANAATQVAEYIRK